MDYTEFNKLFEDAVLDGLTVNNIRQAINGTGTVLCLNKDGYYIDNLDDFFGEDDTIDVSTEIAEQVTALPGITSKMFKGIKIFQILQ